MFAMSHSMLAKTCKLLGTFKHSGDHGDHGGDYGDNSGDHRDHGGDHGGDHTLESIKR